MRATLKSATFMPRAARCLPRAEPDPVKLIEKINSSFNDFKAKYDSKHAEIETELADNAKVIAGARLNGLGGTVGEVVPDPDYSRTFASYFRNGAGEDGLKQANAEGHRAQVQAAMSVGDSGSGGYLAPTEWDRRINKALRSVSPMRRLAQVVTTGVGAYYTLWNTEQWSSGWVGETAARPATTTTTLAQVPFGTGEIYAMPAITQRLLDDAELDLAGWIANELEEEFGRQESIAFISGDGANKPNGLLTYAPGGVSASVHPGGALTVMNSGSATTIPNTDMLIDFVYGLPAPYRQNATWLMNSQTAAFIAKMKDGDDNYIWRESLIVGQPSTLLGRPVELDEAMPSIGAGNMPIAFGDFRTGYLINDRLGVRVQRDPFTNKPYVLFYSTKRVGGGVQDPRAIQLLKIAAA